jgi:hypothetical protein
MLKLYRLRIPLGWFYLIIDNESFTIYFIGSIQF